MMFDNLKQTVSFFHDRLYEFVKARDGILVIDDTKYLLEVMADDDFRLAREEGLTPDNIVKLSYFADVEDEDGSTSSREHVLFFITSYGPVIRTAQDLEELPYADIIEDVMFGFSLYDLGRMNHIYRVLVQEKNKG